MRNVAAVSFAFLSTFFFSTIAIFVGIFNPYSKASNAVIRIWAKSILWAAGIKVEVQGLENLGSEKPAIYIANHQSLFDVLASVAAIPGTVRFIAKKELFRIPIFAQGMRIAGMIEIDRSNSKAAQKSLTAAAVRMRRGVSVIIFPEGTRSRDGNIQAFKKGGFVLAIKGRFPIIPTVIHGSFGIMQKKSLKLSKGKIVVQFLEAVDSSQYTYEDRVKLVNDVRQKILENFEKG